MAISPLSGRLAPKEILVDLAWLEREYYACQPDVTDPNHRVLFGTSGHRGSSLRRCPQGPHSRRPLGDADRHGIVTSSLGLMNPSHYLAVAIHYLLTHRPRWSSTASVGKTLVSSGLIDRVVRALGRTLCEVPVGFKWFVAGLYNGSFCFGGEESARASFLRQDGRVWTTDKDGLIMDLLAAEITARTSKDPGEHYRALSAQLGTPYYTRIDASATPEQKARLQNLSPESVKESKLAGEPTAAKLTCAPGNNAPIGGLKV